jgi:hypothetical protein
MYLDPLFRLVPRVEQVTKANHMVTHVSNAGMEWNQDLSAGARFAQMTEWPTTKAAKPIEFDGMSSRRP